MKKYITPTSEIVSLVVEQMLAQSTYGFNDGTADQWSQKEDLDGDIDWDSED